MFEYHLPPELIADRPKERGHSRLLIGSASGEIEDTLFYNLPQFIQSGTLLLLNDTKVVSCRFFPPEIEDSEVFIVKATSATSFKVLFRPKKKFKVGLVFRLSPSLMAEVIAEDEIALENLSSSVSLENVIADEGRTPIPPYIRDGVSDASDKVTYQTVFAKNPGSIAAPTASLHFSKSLLQELENKGVEIKFLTLHVGLHSIFSIDRQISSGAIAEEEFIVPEETLLAVGKARLERRPILGVGTTVTRAIESLSDSELNGDYDFKFRPTGLFIKPGFNFRVLTRLMTNFHLSGSTHLSLVGAFYGEERLKSLYNRAVKERYRFYSYGDSMLLECN